MKIEVLIRWTNISQATDDDESYARRILDGERGGNRVNVNYEYGPLVLDTDDIKRYNRSNDAFHTTLHLSDGDTYVIKYPYRDFIDLMIELTGQTVARTIPMDWEDPDEVDLDEPDTEGEDEEEDDDFKGI